MLNAQTKSLHRTRASVPLNRGSAKLPVLGHYPRSLSLVRGDLSGRVFAVNCLHAAVEEFLLALSVAGLPLVVLVQVKENLAHRKATELLLEQLKESQGESRLVNETMAGVLGVAAIFHEEINAFSDCLREELGAMSEEVTSLRAVIAQMAIFGPDTEGLVKGGQDSFGFLQGVSIACDEGPTHVGGQFLAKNICVARWSLLHFFNHFLRALINYMIYTRS